MYQEQSRAFKTILALGIVPNLRVQDHYGLKNDGDWKWRIREKKHTVQNFDYYFSFTRFCGMFLFFRRFESTGFLLLSWK